GQIRAGRGRRRAGAGLHQGHGNAFRATAGVSLIGACAGTRFEAGQARPSPAISHLTCVKALRARMGKLGDGQKRTAALEEANMTKSRFGSAIVAVIAIALAASVSSSAVAQTQGTTHTFTRSASLFIGNKALALRNQDRQRSHVGLDDDR